MEKDKCFMQLALHEAQKGGHQTWKNPLVGAVIVKDNQVIATGYHHHYGEPHAERDAIFKLSPEQLFNSTLYVTLEPCNHFGKQPPCSQLIVDSHIKRVVIAQIDPHKLVTGKGITTLKENGIQVTTGVLTDEAEKINEHYTYFYKNDRPWVTLKQAVSLDYKISAGKNDDLSDLLAELSKQEIQSIYVEGGPTLEKSFLDNFFINEMITYIAPNLIGDN